MGITSSNTNSDMDQHSIDLLRKMGTITSENNFPMKQLIGMTEKEANEFLSRNVMLTNGQRFKYVRVVKKDGVNQPRDKDIREERLDVFIENNTITGFDTFI